MNIGARIRFYRQLLNVSGKALADAVNLSPGQIANIENSVNRPSLDALERICAELGMSLAKFFAEEPYVFISSKQVQNPEQVVNFSEFIDGVNGLQEVLKVSRKSVEMETLIKLTTDFQRYVDLCEDFLSAFHDKKPIGRYIEFYESIRHEAADCLVKRLKQQLRSASGEDRISLKKLMHALDLNYL